MVTHLFNHSAMNLFNKHTLPCYSMMITVESNGSTKVNKTNSVPALMELSGENRKISNNTNTSIITIHGTCTEGKRQCCKGPWQGFTIYNTNFNYYLIKI